MIYIALAIYSATLLLVGYRLGEWKMHDRLTGRQRKFLDVVSWRFLFGVFFGAALLLAVQTGYWVALAMIYGRV